MVEGAKYEMVDVPSLCVAYTGHRTIKVDSLLDDENYSAPT